MSLLWHISSLVVRLRRPVHSLGSCYVDDDLWCQYQKRSCVKQHPRCYQIQKGTIRIIMIMRNYVQ